MRSVDAPRWDDLVLAGLLLLIGIPEAVLSALYHQPIDAQGALSIICVMAGLAILIWRNGRWHKPRHHADQ